MARSGDGAPATASSEMGAHGLASTRFGGRTRNEPGSPRTADEPSPTEIQKGDCPPGAYFDNG